MLTPSKLLTSHPPLRAVSETTKLWATVGDAMNARLFRRVVVLLLALALLTPSIGLAKGKSSGGPVHVKGYYRKDGTYVRPHTRSAPGSGGKKSSGSYTPPAVIPPADESPPPKTARKPKSPPRSTPAVEKGTIPKGDTLEGLIVSVTDGDTLTLLVDKKQYKIRLQGIDAPEKNQPFGNQSKKALSGKVFQKTVKVLSQGQDKYGRTLGIVYLDGCVNTAMVKEGWAWHYKEYVDNRSLAKAEEEARAKKVGLWTDAHPVAPWDWRHNKPEAADPFSDDAPTTNSKKQTAETKYWMTNSSGKRHNSGCRYYENSKGHHCGPNDGIPCKICGG